MLLKFFYYSIEVLATKSDTSQNQDVDIQVANVPVSNVQFEVYSIENQNLELNVIPKDNITNSELLDDEDIKFHNDAISLIEDENESENDTFNEEITPLSLGKTNENLKIEDLDSIQIDELKSPSDNESINPKQSSRIKFQNLICYECNEKCATRKDLDLHIEQIHHANVKYKCEFCSQLYEKYRSFTRHVQTHTNKPQYACEECGHTFAQKIGLKNHEFKHKKGRNFECDMCDKSFKQLSSLYNHKKVHSGIKNICEFCKEEFTTQLNLKQHLNSKHFKVKDRICKVCNKGYSSTSALYYHMLSHSKVILKI